MAMQHFLQEALASMQALGGAATSALRIAGIVVAAWLLIIVAQRAIRTLRIRIASRFDDREPVRRAETFGRVFRCLAAAVVSLLDVVKPGEHGGLVERVTLRHLRRDPVYAARILDEIKMAGVERWALSSVATRARLRVAPLAQWTVPTGYLRRLKIAFDRAGIEIPFPQLALHMKAQRALRAR